MSALTVFIIRHAEKPDDGLPGTGNDLNGKADPKSLIIPGWQRAGAWTVLFGSGALAADYPKPDVVYAADPKKTNPDDGKKSKRPFETALPTCERLHIEANLSFGVGEEKDLVEEVTKLTGTVLIAWEHKHIIPGITSALLGKQVIPTLPKKWSGSRFDVVLRFERAQPGAPWSFWQMFPMLLAGDSDVPMKDEK
jgi:hypothetical protein